jgi:hypothetical protein
MDILSQAFSHQRELAALGSVLAFAALLSVGSRYLGKSALGDLTVGPKQLLKDAAITAALYAALVAAVTGFAVTIASSFVLAIPLAAVAAMVAFINAISPAYAMQQNGRAEIAQRKEQGRAMVAHCLKLFQRIDRRGKGLLNEDDLNAAMARADLTVADKAALAYVRDNAATIGSVVERSVTRNHVVPGAMVSGFAVVVPQTTKHYAVSVDDLDTYPQRLEQIYQLWD